MTKIRNVKCEIEDLGITIDVTITIQVFNSFDFLFAQFLSIFNHKDRKKMFFILKSPTKFLENAKLQIKNQDKITVNYAKQFCKENCQLVVVDTGNSSVSKCKFYIKEHRSD